MCNCGCGKCETKSTALVLNESKAPRAILSEGLKYHLDNNKPLIENIYKAGSRKYFDLFAEARSLYSRGILEFTNKDDIKILTETNLGHFGTSNGKRVPLDYPIKEGTFNTDNHVATFDGNDGYAEVYKQADGSFYIVVGGDVDYDMTATDAKDVAAKLKRDGYTRLQAGELKEELQRPIPQDTPNEFAYLDFKKWAYKHRGQYKKDIKAAGDNTSKIWEIATKWWIEWAKRKDKVWSSIIDPHKFGRALVVMMWEDNLIFDKNSNKITRLKENIDMDRVFMHGKDQDEYRRGEREVGNKINKARAKAHFKMGEKIAVVHKVTKNVMPIEDIRQIDTFDTNKYDFAYLVERKLNEQGYDAYDEIANVEFGMDYDQLGPNEQEWVRDEYDNQPSGRDSIDENKNSSVNFVKRLLQQTNMGFGTKALTPYQISRIIEELFAHKIISENLNEDRFGHPITAQSNQLYIQVEKLIKLLSGEEKRDVEKAFRIFWKTVGPAKEAEEQKERVFTLNEVHKLLRQTALSPAEWAKAKKLKGFDPKNYLWDKKQELHIIRQMYSHTDKLNPYTGEEEVNENDEKKEYDNLLDKEYELTNIYQNNKTEENWDKLNNIRKKGRRLEKKLADKGKLPSHLKENQGTLSSNMLDYADQYHMELVDTLKGVSTFPDKRTDGFYIRFPHYNGPDWTGATFGKDVSDRIKKSKGAAIAAANKTYDKFQDYIEDYDITDSKSGVYGDVWLWVMPKDKNIKEEEWSEDFGELEETN